jgi:hypothetical protein
MAVGLKGLGAFTKIVDSSGTLSVDLMQESDDNAVLNRFRTIDKETDGGVGVSVVLKDITGPDSVSCLVCHISGPPDISKGSPGDIYTWNFLGVDWVPIYGGRAATPTINFGDLPELPNIPAYAPPPV